MVERKKFTIDGDDGLDNQEHNEGHLPNQGVIIEEIHEGEDNQAAQENQQDAQAMEQEDEGNLPVDEEEVANADITDDDYDEDVFWHGEAKRTMYSDDTNIKGGDVRFSYFCRED